jgi:hypothetical protein
MAPFKHLKNKGNLAKERLGAQACAQERGTRTQNDDQSG